MKTSRFSKSGIRYAMKSPLVRAGGLACLAAALALVVAGGYWWPAQRANLELAEQVAAGRRALVEARQAEELAEVYAQDLRDVPLLERKLETAVDQTRIIEGLGHLAREHGLRIVNQSYSERAGSPTGDELVVELAVEGTYAAVRNFLHGLARLPVWLEAQEVLLAKSDETGVVKGRLRLINYRLRDGVAREGT